MQTAALTFWAEPQFIDALKAYADERGDLPRAQGAWQADPDERHVDRRSKSFVLTMLPSADCLQAV